MSDTRMGRENETQFYPYGTPTDWERQRIANLILEQKGMNEADLHGLRRTLENYINRNGGKNEWGNSFTREKC